MAKQTCNGVRAKGDRRQLQSGRYGQLKWNGRVWARDDIGCTSRIGRNGGSGRGLKVPDD